MVRQEWLACVNVCRIVLGYHVYLIKLDATEILTFLSISYVYTFIYQEIREQKIVFRKEHCQLYNYSSGWN